MAQPSSSSSWITFSSRSSLRSSASSSSRLYSAPHPIPLHSRDRDSFQSGTCASLKA
ncbi:Hypothetical predicted protein [Prunus dulcis]|uniref:Uncharacterized protein n=1 Tax=Prunus dulcis TaxID=3755 RepID=A0A5E4FJ12_PRUDU|nr:Hypothetical predicted protein [Prunus dulcis]